MVAERSLGSCQDMTCKGTAAVYWNWRYYIEFLNDCLKSHKDNILQNNLLIVLISMEMVTLRCVLTILHFCICTPMCWLTGNTHRLGTQGYDWSVRLMQNAINALEEAMVAIKNNGSIFLVLILRKAYFPNLWWRIPAAPWWLHAAHVW